MSVEKEIYTEIEINESVIFTNDYPASVASELLVNKLDFDYDLAKTTFIKYCDDMGVIYNIDNF